MKYTKNNHKIGNKTLIINLLGSIELMRSGQALTGLAYEKGRAILAYLATESEQSHSRQKLANFFWPDLPIETARTNLRQVLLNLRQVLGDISSAYLITDQQSIRFNPECDHWLDVKEFFSTFASCTEHFPSAKCNVCLEQMDHAAEIYRGFFLEDLQLDGLPDFEGWLYLKRESYHRHALALLERLGDCHEQNGNLAKALQLANRYLELNPWDEVGHRRLMRLLALNGHTASALAQFESCQRILQKELSVSPDAQTIELFQQIKARRFDAEKLQAESVQKISAITVTDEYRQITAMYCGFFLPSTNDPEDISEQLIAAQNLVKEIIHKQGGHIAQIHGGAILGYFGYPTAQEDAVRRAVLSALSLPKFLDTGLQFGVGIHTGMAITSANLPDTLGLISLLATRLHNANHPVVISEATRCLISGYFHVEPLGFHEFYGVAEAVQTFLVTGESSARHRLDTTEQLTPLVGRASEIEILLALWEQVKQGTSHSVLIQGDAGIGKSRLAQTLKERLIKQSCFVYELRCFPEFSQSPFQPLIAMIESLCDFASSDTPQARFGKLVHHLKDYYPNVDIKMVPMLAQLFSLPSDSTSNISLQKEKLNALLLDLLHKLSTKQPVFIIIEDLHWIDPSTLELLTLFINKQRKGAVFVMLTARSEFKAPWKKSNDREMKLTPLSEKDVASIVDFWRKDIGQETRHRIMKCSDGIPLYIEEMAKMALDTQQNIPITLRDLLAAKLDQMGETKLTALLAATIGREFDLNLLRMISPIHATLQDKLNELQEAGLILAGAGGKYQFKHALIQEAAYQSQTKANRQMAHRKIAEALQSQFTETLPEILAQHWLAAGEIRLAIDYWIKAGQRAMLNSANVEAAKYMDCAIQHLKSLPLDEQRDRLEIQLCLILGAAMIATRGFGSAEAGQAYSRALKLSENMGDSTGLYQALWGMWLTSSSRTSHTHSLELAEKLLYLAKQGNDILQLQQAHYAMGNSQLWTGHPDQGRYHLEASIALYQPSHHPMMATQFGENVYASSNSLLVLVLWIQGYPDQAIKVSKHTVDLARQLNHPFNLGYALAITAMLNRWIKRLEIAEQFAGECVSVSDEFGFPFWLGMAATTAGWTLSMRGNTEGIAQIRQCLDAVNAVMSGTKLLFFVPLCDALVHLELFDDALVALNETLNITNEKNDRFFESEFHRLKGECLLGLSIGNRPEAKACFRKALKISRKQGAKSLELRAAISLARHFKNKKLLSKVYAWFTEGFDMPDLIEARNILDF